MYKWPSGLTTDLRSKWLSWCRFESQLSIIFYCLDDDDDDESDDDDEDDYDDNDVRLMPTS